MVETPTVSWGRGQDGRKKCRPGMSSENLRNWPFVLHSLIPDSTRLPSVVWTTLSLLFDCSEFFNKTSNRSTSFTICPGQFNSSAVLLPSSSDESRPPRFRFFAFASVVVFSLLAGGAFRFRKSKRHAPAWFREAAGAECYDTIPHHKISNVLPLWHP